jgi:hypothetical protein
VQFTILRSYCSVKESCCLPRPDAKQLRWTIARAPHFSDDRFYEVYFGNPLSKGRFVELAT